MLGIRDRALALDFDCALAIRAHGEIEAAIEDAADGGDGAFFALVVTLLRALI